MTELTLESLAERVAALEELIERATGYRVQNQPGMPLHVTRPGTGDWEAFERAARELRKTYDFDAVREQDELEWRIARDQLP